MQSTKKSVLRIDDVRAEFCPLSRIRIRQLVAAGEFPAPINIGPRAVGWLRADLEAWLATMASKQRERLARKAAKQWAARPLPDSHVERDAAT